MSDELNALEQNINNNFAEILASAGSDYRFILITDHRSGPAGTFLLHNHSAPQMFPCHCRTATALYLFACLLYFSAAELTGNIQTCL
jgi:hypothetical protein